MNESFMLKVVDRRSEALTVLAGAAGGRGGFDYEVVRQCGESG